MINHTMHEQPVTIKAKAPYFAINDVNFLIEDSGGVLKWGWSTEKAESGSFPTQDEALKDAVRHVLEREQADRETRRRDDEDRRYGAYEEQLQRLYNDTRL